MSRDRTRNRASGFWLAAVGLACTLPMSGWSPLAQPEPQNGAKVEQPSGGRPSSSPRRTLDKDAIKKRLEQRIAEMQENEKRLKEAVAALDRGDSPEQIRKLFPEAGRWRGLFEEGGRESSPPFHRDGEPGGPEGRGGPDGDVSTPPGPGEGGGRFRREGGPGGERGGRQLTDADREAIREILTHAAPEMISTLDELMERDPASGRQKLLEVFPRMRGMLELRDRDPKIYRLRLDDLSLARQSLPIAKEILTLRENGTPADSAELTSKVAQLRGLMTKQFDNRVSGMKIEIEMMEKKRADRQASLEEMSRTRDDRINDLVEVLINRSGKPGADKDLLGPSPRREPRPAK